MRIRNEECFVLRTIPISESSLIVDVFTRNHGRISLMAKGARRLKSQFRGSIRPFQLSLVNWSGKGDIPVMTSLTSKQAPVDVSGRRVYCSYYLNELIIRFLRQLSPYPKLFDTYCETLVNLADPENEFHVLRVFELRLLKFLGYELTFKIEADGTTPIDPNLYYDYDFEIGAKPVAHPTSDAIKGESLLALANEKFTIAAVRYDSQRLLRRAIEYYSEGKTNRSREVFRQTIRINC